MPAQPAQEVGPRRVVRVVPVEVEAVDDRQSGRRSLDLGQRDGPVERDDGGGGHGVQLVVEGEHLAPVGVRGVAASVCTALTAASSW